MNFKKTLNKYLFLGLLFSSAIFFVAEANDKISAVQVKKTSLSAKEIKQICEAQINNSSLQFKATAREIAAIFAAAMVVAVGGTSIKTGTAITAEQFALLMQAPKEKPNIFANIMSAFVWVFGLYVLYRGASHLFKDHPVIQLINSFLGVGSMDKVVGQVKEIMPKNDVVVKEARVGKV